MPSAAVVICALTVNEMYNSAIHIAYGHYLGIVSGQVIFEVSLRQEPSINNLEHLKLSTGAQKTTLCALHCNKSLLRHELHI